MQGVMKKKDRETPSAAAIAEIFQEYERTAKSMELKLDEVAEKEKAWEKDRGTLLNQCAWLSEENGRHIESNVHLTEQNVRLLQENEELRRSKAELLTTANSEKDQELLRELQTAHAALQKEKEIATRNLNLLEEKIGTSEELQKKAEALAAEIQRMDEGKDLLAKEIEMLEGRTGFSDLHYWIRTALRLSELAKNKSTRESREEAGRIIAKMPDLALYGNIPDLYEYTESVNGSKK